MRWTHIPQEFVLCQESSSVFYTNYLTPHYHHTSMMVLPCYRWGNWDVRQEGNSELRDIVWSWDLDTGCLTPEPWPLTILEFRTCDRPTHLKLWVKGKDYFGIGFSHGKKSGEEEMSEGTFLGRLPLLRQPEKVWFMEHLSHNILKFEAICGFTGKTE